jgi:sterol 3beta-glucosyltransferase
VRITILSYGSRGDVQPYLALGLGLARAGHTVRLAAPEVFGPFVQQYASQAAPGRLDFAPLPGDPAQLMQSAGGGSWPARWLPYAVRMAMVVTSHVAPLAASLFSAARTACCDADLVIHSLLTTVVGRQVAREAGAADLSALVFPVFSPTCAFPNPLFGPWPGWMGIFGQRWAAFGPRYNFLTHREFSRVFWHGNQMGIDHLRRSDPSLEPLREWLFAWPDGILPHANPAKSTPVLYGISPHALPRPADWGANAHLTGYWFLEPPPGWQPAPGLVDFLQSGPPPVYIGFGSLIPRDAKRLSRLVLQALEQTGQRGVLLSGWAGLNANLPAGSALAERVFAIQEAPFDWLFPHMAAVVHHGGMGTTAAALRAGVPSVIVPFTFDQPFWGRQVHALGAGPAPIRPRQLTAGRLAAAIRAALEDGAVRARAAQLGQHIQQEDGVAEAVRKIEGLFAPGS